MTDKAEALQAFAKRIETRLKAGGGDTDSMERLICRLLTGKKVPPQVVAGLAAKWVEWRYGKAPQHNTHANADGEPFKVIFESVEKD